eukprot:5324-Heterococcus_DN1.PRE.1
MVRNTHQADTLQLEQQSERNLVRLYDNHEASATATATGVRTATAAATVALLLMKFTTACVTQLHNVQGVYTLLVV